MSEKETPTEDRAGRWPSVARHAMVISALGTLLLLGGCADVMIKSTVSARNTDRPVLIGPMGNTAGDSYSGTVVDNFAIEAENSNKTTVTETNGIGMVTTTTERERLAERSDKFDQELARKSANKGQKIVVKGVNVGARISLVGWPSRASGKETAWTGIQGEIRQ